MNVLIWVQWGCAALELPPEPNCEARVFGWPDANGDGIGDAGGVYIGCDLPDGYVTVPPMDTDVGSTTASGGPTTSDTAATDTGTTDTGLPTTPGTTPTGTDTGAP